MDTSKCLFWCGDEILDFIYEVCDGALFDVVCYEGVFMCI